MTDELPPHTRRSDEAILMQFAEDQGWDEPEVMAAVLRLRECHAKGLQDYSIPVESPGV